MQAKKRYFFLLSVGACSVLLFWTLLGTQVPAATRPSGGGGGQHHRSSSSSAAASFSVQQQRWPRFSDPLPGFASRDPGATEEEEEVVSPRQRRDTAAGDVERGGGVGGDGRGCRMDSCFDASLCRRNGGFRVYVYPRHETATQQLSDTYRDMLAAVESSRFFTPDPERACLFVPSLDTLDRDRLSPHYVHGLRAKLQGLARWNGGRNHLVFNLYAGTWPDYNTQELGVELGHAMVARASAAKDSFRPRFDVSLPLFSKDHPRRGGGVSAGGDGGPGSSITRPRRYLLVFKGKRYLTGIGSDTRNALHHVHNARDVVLLTTCRHGKDWRRHEDARCERDNAEYDR